LEHSRSGGWLQTPEFGGNGKPEPENEMPTIAAVADHDA
jgi:hypothetical protein